MTGGNTNQSRIYLILDELYQALREGGIAPLDDSSPDFSALSEDQRRILTLLIAPNRPSDHPVTEPNTEGTTNGGVPAHDEKTPTPLNESSKKDSEPVFHEHLPGPAITDRDEECRTENLGASDPAIEAGPHERDGGSKLNQNMAPKEQNYITTQDLVSLSETPIEGKAESQAQPTPATSTFPLSTVTQNGNFEGTDASTEHTSLISPEKTVSTTGETDSLSVDGVRNEECNITSESAVNAGTSSRPNKSDTDHRITLAAGTDVHSSEPDYANEARREPSKEPHSNFSPRNPFEPIKPSISKTEIVKKESPKTEAGEASITVSNPQGPKTNAGIQAVSVEQYSDRDTLETQSKSSRPGDYPAVPNQSEAQGGSTMVLRQDTKISFSLPNARAGEHHVFEVERDGIRSLKLRDKGSLDLDFDEDKGILSGTPMIPGDYVLEFGGLLNERPITVQAHLAVIPDPRSLWIPEPSKFYDPFWKEDYDCVLLSSGDLCCVAASKRGRSHAQEGLFRDDDFRLWNGGPGGWSISVVADGAGSAKLSRRGSEIAVRTITEKLPRLLDKHLTEQIDDLVDDWLNKGEAADQRIRTQLYLSLTTAAFEAAKSVGQEASKLEKSASEYSTTLVLSAARKCSHGWFIAGFSIGDGGAAVFDLPSRIVVPLTQPDSGEFAGETRFLHSSEFEAGYEGLSERIFFDVRDDLTAIVTMTDGVTDPKFPTDAAFRDPEVWLKFWDEDLRTKVDLDRDNPNLDQELLNWLDFWSPGDHDDRTIAIMLP